MGMYSPHQRKFRFLIEIQLFLIHAFQKVTSAFLDVLPQGYWGSGVGRGGVGVSGILCQKSAWGKHSQDNPMTAGVTPVFWDTLLQGSWDGGRGRLFQNNSRTVGVTPVF